MAVLRPNKQLTASHPRFFYRDVCDKIDAPDGLENFYHLIPCNRMTVLDCFQEGGFDFVSPSELNLLWTYLTIIAPDPELKSMLQVGGVFLGALKSALKSGGGAR